jgi:hypothetical protein
MTLRKSGPGPDEPPRIPVDLIAERIASAVIGHVGERTENGIDIDGQPFAPYSPTYAEARARAARARIGSEPLSSVPNLTMSGGMLNSVQVLEREHTETSSVIAIGPDTGTSPQRRTPPKTKPRKRTKSEGRSPSHNDLGLYHQEGMGRLPQRRWLGVSPEGEASITRQAQDALPPIE